MYKLYMIINIIYKWRQYMHTIRKVFLVLIVITCFSLFSCYGGGDMEDYSECYYDIGSSTGIDSVRVLYPCAVETSSGTFNATTLSGGFTNTKENMYWIGKYVAEQGIIVFAVSASNNSSVNGYENAQEACYNLIKSENNNSRSPLYGKIGKIGLMGYSMGGGAVLNVGNDLGSSVQSVIALAPYNPESNLSGTRASTFIFVGENDGVAGPGLNAEPAYEDLPDTITKMLAEMDSFGHLEWVDNTSTEGDYPKSMIVAWLKYTFTGDQSSYQLLKNPTSKIVVYETNNL